MIPAINLEAMIHKWVEEQMRRGGWDGYEDWKERDQYVVLPKDILRHAEPVTGSGSFTES